MHGGGPKGKALLDKVKAAGATVVDCPPVKAWELPQFVSAEAKQLGTPIEPGAAQVLVDAVGHDLRALAAAVRQLAADSEGGRLTADQVRRYFAGRSEVTSFAVADAALAGRTGLAMEQLRWALSTGVAPVLVTSALAAGVRGLGKLVTAGGGLREADLAREVGVPPWKLKSMRAQARGWDAAGLAHALQAVAVGRRGGQGRGRRRGVRPGADGADRLPRPPRLARARQARSEPTSSIQSGRRGPPLLDDAASEHALRSRAREEEGATGSADLARGARNQIRGWPWRRSPTCGWRPGSCG